MPQQARRKQPGNLCEDMSNQQSTTVTNKLSGERSTMKVEFATTGVPQADLLSAISACVDALKLNSPIDPYILGCIFESIAKQQFEHDRRIKEGTERYRVTSPSPIPSPFINPEPYAPGFPMSPWQTTCGSAGASIPEPSLEEKWEAMKARYHAQSMLDVNAKAESAKAALLNDFDNLTKP